jgi:hypothetical protein
MVNSVSTTLIVSVFIRHTGENRPRREDMVRGESMADAILKLAYEVSRVTEEKVALIDNVMRRTSVLALNARLEAARAGVAGAAFAVVAQEMGSLAGDIRAISGALRDAVATNIEKLQSAGSEVQFALRGERFADLARSAVEIIDRNLYERSCDVRWWATDSAVVDALALGDTASLRFASRRLATILRSYTVYLDLWVADRSGRIVATGRPDLYATSQGADVSHAEWFRRGMATASGDDFAVCDIQRNPLLGEAAVASYSTAIRAGGERDGEPLGALGIFFDWAPQAQAIVEGIGLTGEERDSCRVMLLSSQNLVLASSDGNGMLAETFDLRHNGSKRGYYRSADRTIAYAQTPGYETYRGLGWWGCIEQHSQPDDAL